ncbi:MAG: hypothetical protein ACLU18_16295 [Bacteroides thetaiotaomicron]
MGKTIIEIEFSILGISANTKNLAYPPSGSFEVSLEKALSTLRYFSRSPQRIDIGATARLEGLRLEQ